METNARNIFGICIEASMNLKRYQYWIHWDLVVWIQSTGFVSERSQVQY